MDQESQKIIYVLEKYLGSTAGLFYLRELKELNIEGSLKDVISSKKEVLAKRICDNLLSKSLSPQKLTFERSRIYSILGLNEKLNKRMDVESIGWG